MQTNKWSSKKVRRGEAVLVLSQQRFNIWNAWEIVTYLEIYGRDHDGDTNTVQTAIFQN